MVKYPFFLVLNYELNRSFQYIVEDLVIFIETFYIFNSPTSILTLYHAQERNHGISTNNRITNSPQ